MTIFRVLPFIVALHAGIMAPSARAAEEIRVGFPEVFSETGQRRERFDAAIARELCRSIGKSCRTVEIKSMSGMEDLFARRVDVLVSYYDSLVRKDWVAATRDYVRIPFAFVVRKDSGIGEISPAALAGKTVAAGDLQSRGFVATRFPKSIIGLQENFLGGLAAGQVDLAVTKLSTAVYEIDRASSDSTCCTVAEIITDDISSDSGSRVLVRKSDKTLKELVDKTIGEMERSGKITAAAMAIFGFDLSPGAKLDNPHFPTAPETSYEIEPAIAERAVKLVMPQGRCSGVLVSGKAVLTAAHCFANEKSKVIVKPRQVTLYQNDKKLPRKGARIVIHPDYRALTSQDVGSSDIALLLLDDGGPTLPPLRFLTGDELFLATDMMDLLFIDAALYGYGNRDRKDDRLLKSRARLSLVVPRPGSFLGQAEKIFVKSREFCSGDSGGGLFFAPGGIVSAAEAPLLLGIASTTGEAKGLCDDKGEIIRADFFAGWMAATLKEHGAD